ncbi:MAG: tRNA epoxyqueuosine(34) reductase QueG [Pseudomonadales bacterium]
MNTEELHNLREQITALAQELGFQDVGVSNVELGDHEAHLESWLQQQYHGSMEYMASHGLKRSQPDKLVPGTLRVLSVRMDYTPGDQHALDTLEDGNKAYIARYALGRDYHKLMRKRLAKLADAIRKLIHDEYNYRAFVDSAPVLERALAENSGLGWIGKNTMLLNSKAGSWFFLGELFTDIPLPVDDAQESSHCGSCTACLDICPTNAFVKPWVLDARRCISYLTIESYDPIPLELRPLMGNRIFGCDDCQLVCPWNKFAQASNEADFSPRHDLDNSDLLTLFAWTEEEFFSKTEGSAIRRIGYDRWLRNLAVALGNAPASATIIKALSDKQEALSDRQKALSEKQKALSDTKKAASNMVLEHCQWAIDQQQLKSTDIISSSG